LLTKSKKYYFDNEAIKEKSVCNHSSGNGYKRSARLSYQNSDGSSRGSDSEYHVAETRNRRSVWSINTKPYKGSHFATFPIDLVDVCAKSGTSEKGVCSKCGKPFTRVVERKRLSRTDLPVDDPRYRPNIYNGSYGSINGKKDAAYTSVKTVGWEPSCTCNADCAQSTVLDPFGGSGTVGQWCKYNNRNAILIELNKEYISQIYERISKPIKTCSPECEETVETIINNNEVLTVEECEVILEEDEEELQKYYDLLIETNISNYDLVKRAYWTGKGIRVA